MDFILHGYCGLYCGACLIMLNTKAEAGTERCYGCKSEQPDSSYIKLFGSKEMRHPRSSGSSLGSWIKRIP
jgi:hypothetical protein